MSTESPKERHEIIGIIPARAGSKRLPNKNRFRLTANLTLVQWTLLQAIRSGVFDRLVVSTNSYDIWSDAQDAFPPINAVTLDASTFLVKYEGRSVAVERHYRKPEHATDQAPTMDVLQDYLSEHRPEIDKLVLLQPTSPFRHEQTLKRVLDSCNDENPFVFTGKTVPTVFKQSHERDNFQCLPVRPVPGLESGNAIVPNGNLYIWKIEYAPDNPLDGDMPVCLSIKPAVVIPHNILENVDIDEYEQAKMATAWLDTKHVPPGLISGYRLS